MQKIFIACFVVGSIQTFAQKSFFGIDAGVNLANQRDHFSLTINNTTVIGSTFRQNVSRATIGFFYQYALNKKIAIRLNAQYMGLGYKSPNIISPTFPNDITIQYLTLPLTLHYWVSEHLSFNAGPYLSFTLGGTEINNEPITKTYHKNDFGFSFGGEHDLYKNIAIGINYIFGLKNIWLNDVTNNSGLPEYNKYTNRALKITLIYKFRKNK